MWGKNPIFVFECFANYDPPLPKGTASPARARWPPPTAAGAVGRGRSSLLTSTTAAPQATLAPGRHKYFSQEKV